MNYIKALLITGMALILNACGGGGGTSDTTTVLMETPPIEYDLRTYIDKSTLTLNLEGTIDGTTVQGTSYITYEGTVDYLGTTLDLHQEVLVLNGIAETSYAGTYLGNVYFIERSARDCYIVAEVTPTPIPTNATIGYVSDVVPLECTDGYSMEVLVKLEAGEGDSAVAVATATVYDDFGTLVGISETFSTLDPSMNLLAYEIRGGSSLFLEATSITQN